MSEPRIVAVVAMAENGIIGRQGAMPWRLPTDLKRYRRLTMGKPMIMGRKTLESIGRILDGRDTIVLSHQAALPVAGAHLAASPNDALTLARDLASGRGSDEIVIAGGGEIYRLFLDRTERLYVTLVAATPEGDARFPDIDEGIWLKVQDETVPATEKDSAAMRFLVFDRR
ncbi:dihydrofolate reductase [Consotaella salsifontis]|uniref:Dihydrofolate reductase n=1 Tax=Consotaella salsifontis TaxID=1365950 RepID=A0A1T4RBP5_9HYPH|nr:dihydrofolate reductase [Consotaella salsifontis]SKA13375.1 dihydrofolate reductase [Consotaella salsifontis]